MRNDILNNESVNIYKILHDYDGCYCVTNNGDVINFGFKRPHMLKGSVDAEGYIQMALKKDGKLYYPLLHRLVAEAFLTNPDGLDHLHHIDGDTRNNNVNNLKYVSASEHKQIHLSDRGMSRDEQFIPKVVDMVDEDGNVIKTFSTEANAVDWLKKNGYSNARQSGVSKVCCGIKKAYYGYRFRFA